MKTDPCHVGISAKDADWSDSGVVVGLTGLGAGVLLLPIMIFGLGVSPIVAVGLDAAFNAVTRIGAGYLHCKQRTVDWRLIAGLSIGGIPASLGRVLLVTHLRATYGNEVNSILRSSIGALLVFIPLLLLFQSRRSNMLSFPAKRERDFGRALQAWG
jgi:uncharacterized protein